MKNKIFFPVSVFLVLGMTGCSPKSAPLDEAPEYQRKEYINYQEAYPDDNAFLISDGWSNSTTTKDPFGCTWYKSQLTGNEDGLSFKVEKTDNMDLIKNSEGELAPNFDPYLGAEMKTNASFKYGFFGCYMKPSNVRGTVSTFFTYTGPGEDNPHDEIDIEFLGKNTRKVQFNYYAGSDKSHEKMYNLPFDASEDYHHYGFYWDEHEITWYIDFKPVFRVVGKTPSHECKLFSSHWKVNSKDIGISTWGGTIDESKLPSVMMVKNLDIATKDGQAIENLPEGIPYDICPSDARLSSMPISWLWGNDLYQYSQDEQGHHIQYENAAAESWQCFEFESNGQDLQSKKWISLTIKNEGAKKARIRMQVRNGDGTSTLEIKKAWLDGNEEAVEIEASQYAKFTIPSSETKTITVSFYGKEARRIMFFADTIDREEDDLENKDGHLVITNSRYGGKQEYIDTDVCPDDSTVNTQLTIDHVWYDTEYSVTLDDQSNYVVSYENVNADSYKFVEFANWDMTMSGKRFLRFTIQNTGANARIRLTVRDNSGDNPNALRIVKGWVNGSEDRTVVMENGTDFVFTAFEAQRSVITIEYSGEGGCRMLFGIDSCEREEGDTGAKSNTLTFENWLAGGVQ